MSVVELIVWIILFGFFAGLVLMLDYWGRLLQAQDTFTRDELVDFPSILLRQVERLTSASREPGLAYLSLAAGVGMAWFIALFGGLLSPDVTSAPDHAENQVPNYFFQSLLLVVILHIVWPSLQQIAADRGGDNGILARLTATDTSFFFAMSCALAAINVAVWGVHHEMSFLFCGVNAVMCLVYAGYRLYQLELAPPRDEADEYADFEDEAPAARARGERRPADRDRKAAESEDEFEQDGADPY